MTHDLAKLQGKPRQVDRWQHAQRLLLGGQPARALAIYHDLARRFPGVAQLWAELGIAATSDLEFAMAEQAFRRAEDLSPNDVPTLVLLGQQYHRLRQTDRARACFERAAAADPASIHGQLSLAAWYERERRLPDAWACVERCLACHPGDPQVLCVRALLLHRQDRNAEAERLLREIVSRGSADANVNYSSRQLLGVVLDELGQFSEAMRWLCEAKALLRRTADTARMEKDYDLADLRRRELLASLTPESIRRWRAEGPALPNRRRLALLGGHPRSGTTLLEQILGAHPGILAFDESEAFVSEIWGRLAPMHTDSGLTPAFLDGLPPHQRAEMSRRYFKSLLREVRGEPTAELLLDKNPSPTMSLHLWLRLFPDSKVIVALRDPRDVVVSCFFQNLALTPTNANFLTLERTARHYASLMDVWLRLRELGGFDWIESRYEEVVNNPETEGRRVTEFVGLSWHPDQANHREVARHKILFAPTFSDVAKPIHTRAVGRWQHYAEQLAPIQERLAPYSRAFGYSHS